MLYVYAALAGYLCGSVPTGVLLGHVVGRDPRAAGSGNIGASNVTRTLGKKWGALTLLVDAAKGALPAWLAWRYGTLGTGVVAGAMAVAGHCWSPWLRFDGGKGVATAFGSLVVFAPGVVAVSVVVWVGLVVFTRVPAIGSITAAGLFVVLARVDEQPFEVQTFTVVLLLIILLRHHRNIAVLAQRYGKR